MSYLALARKWRPRTFAELVGQEHITKALINSLNQQRVHHAYLFTGTRGVGKTSLARLMAKALNCEQGLSALPCLHCDACMAIEQGSFIDLIEIDGASKTRVEDTRELMDNVAYAPTNARYKIYLIDEVHMLSQHSFNALLKTLEEPPSHVKFLLATTEPQKLPITVLSRCLQFTLKHLSVDTIKAKLAFILEEERFAFEEEALLHLAKAARGSMRDALSLLDQALAAADDCLSTKNMKQILGMTQQDYALQILKALAETKAEALIHCSRQIAEEGGQFSYVLEEMLAYLHQMTLCQNLPPEQGLVVIAPEIKQLAQEISAEDAQLFYHIGIKGLQEMSLAPSLYIGFEMVLLRMLAFKPAAAAPLLPPLAHEQPKQVPPSSPPPLPALEEAKKTVSLTGPLEDWGAVLKKIKLSGLAQNAADNASLLKKDGAEIVLGIDKGHHSLFTQGSTERIEAELSRYYQEAIRIRLVLNEGFAQEIPATPAQQKQMVKENQQQEAEASIENDAFLKQLEAEFSAKPVKGSVALLD